EHKHHSKAPVVLESDSPTVMARSMDPSVPPVTFSEAYAKALERRARVDDAVGFGNAQELYCELLPDAEAAIRALSAA
ncbi:hypothetical protein T484DRAFT_1865466, partial [Baffinella frigidus]